MWLLTPSGFFSIVQKPEDVKRGTLTVRARVRSDLESLKQSCLPGMGDIQESISNDYRFRTIAPRSEVAAAVAAMVEQLDYSNFKNQVEKQQGQPRASLYHDVWDVLYHLQTQPQKYMTNKPAYHPRRNENGKLVALKSPSLPTGLDTWAKQGAMSCVVPQGAMPPTLNDIAFQSWSAAPTMIADWEALASQFRIEEPPFNAPNGYKRSAGVVVRESDGRIWLVAPSNGFGGYKATFPKGQLDGRSPQAAALTEAFEETGLQVRILSHLIDVKRTTTYTRYYLAERIGGNPADMGWESQAVMLVPQEKLGQIADNRNEVAIIEALSNVFTKG